MGEHVNAKWNTFLRLSRCDCLNYLKFQFDRDNFYQLKRVDRNHIFQFRRLNLRTAE